MTGTFFGDFDVDDAFDTAEPDPEQVARRLHLIRQRVERLAGGRDLDDYDDLGADERSDLEAVGEQIVAYVTSHTPNNRHNLAAEIHEASRIRRNSGETWNELSDEERRLGDAIGLLIADWLIRQGGWH